jgi:hypothetical protein
MSDAIAICLHLVSVIALVLFVRFAPYGPHTGMAVSLTLCFNFALGRANQRWRDSQSTTHGGARAGSR